MSLSLESLMSHAKELQKKFDEASIMAHQVAGALSLIKSQIQQINHEQSMKELQQDDQAHSEEEEQPA